MKSKLLYLGIITTLTTLSFADESKKISVGAHGGIGLYSSSNSATNSSSISTDTAVLYGVDFDYKVAQNIRLGAFWTATPPIKTVVSGSSGPITASSSVSVMMNIFGLDFGYYLIEGLTLGLKTGMTTIRSESSVSVSYGGVTSSAAGSITTSAFTIAPRVTYDYALGSSGLSLGGELGSYVLFTSNNTGYLPEAVLTLKYWF
jgi:hypothetical protein